MLELSADGLQFSLKPILTPLILSVEVHFLTSKKKILLSLFPAYDIS